MQVELHLVLKIGALHVRAATAGLDLTFAPEDLVEHELKTDRLLRVLECWCPPFAG